MRVRLLIVLLAAALSYPAAALADAASSSNWAGYAVHRAGLSFRSVVAVWRQPRASCMPGKRTYSAYWVGLGGFNPRSRALEQVGTELDCRKSGRTASSAWYELVPAPSRAIRLTVRPGNLIAASVKVVGHRVTLSLYDISRHRGFRKIVHAAAADVSSAEWIVEAPSVCINLATCVTLPLANFGSATFALARARSRRGHLGSVSDAAWQSTRITLRPGGRRFVVSRGPGAVAGAASPSALLAAGSSFTVSWSPVAVEASAPGILWRGCAAAVPSPRFAPCWRR